MIEPQLETIAGHPLLATKLYAPVWRPGLVSRPRLVARLARGCERALTLVSAQAGFGKTTLLAEWLTATSGQTVAWVSLDESDNESPLFWSYLITALQQARPGFGAEVLIRLQSPQPPPAEALLPFLLNELAALDQEIVLVLDDYHVITARPIHDAVTFLLDRMPPRLHVVIASRADPPLPLARYRARGQLTELRAADLRFTPGEAATFFNAAMGLALTTSDITALEARTEGWIAGLQLAALSLQGREDAHAFVDAFAGDDHFVLDYLVDEVLRRQPQPVRDFLLTTSILDRLGASLCDAVTGRDDSGLMLETLDRGNLFVVPLDDKRRWYRYHHLFADVLRAHALAEHPGHHSAAHRRASVWFAREGEHEVAIRHAFAAKDDARAAELIEIVTPAMRRNRRETALLGWLRALPDAELRRRPVLSNVYAGVLLQCGETEGVERRLRDAEHWLEVTGHDNLPGDVLTGMAVVDQEELRRLPGAVAVHRAGYALSQGDTVTTVHHARRARDLVVDGDNLSRGAAAALLGLVAWTNGELAGAYRAFAEGMEHIQRAGYLSDAIGGVNALADIRVAQGRLHDAMRTYERVLRLANARGEPVPRGTADIYVGMSELHHERGNLEIATECLRTSAQLGEYLGFPQHPYRWRVATARLRVAHGEYDDALVLLDEAERRYVSDFFPNVRPITAIKARVWIALGRLDDALAWAHERGLSVNDKLSYSREFEHITLARMLLARARSGDAGAGDEAIRLLERLLAAAEAGERGGSVIEILILLALARAIRGAPSPALLALERALSLAAPEGYARIFLDEGQPMRDLLHRVSSGQGTYARRLLTAVRLAEATPAPASGLPEPLTAREIEIMRLIAAGLRNQEIADRLFISLPTVKRHIANAYGKLGAGHRTEALLRAGELNLL